MTRHRNGHSSSWIFLLCSIWPRRVRICSLWCTLIQAGRRMLLLVTPPEPDSCTPQSRGWQFSTLGRRQRFLQKRKIYGKGSPLKMSCRKAGWGTSTVTGFLNLPSPTNNLVLNRQKTGQPTTWAGLGQLSPPKAQADPVLHSAVLQQEVISFYPLCYKGERYPRYPREKTTSDAWELYKNYSISY